MAIKRYKANADTTIVNAFKSDLRYRGTGSNMGEADVMEVFSIYGRVTTSSQELSRALIKFPVDTISTDRSNSVLPASGNVSFYLRVFNAEHSKTVPRDYSLVVRALSQSWQEGVGLDLEGYKDATHGNTGANWMSASSTAKWTSVGGDYVVELISTAKSQSFETGLEDLEIDITQMVEDWLTGFSGGKYNNYGLGVFLSSSYEAQFSSSTGENSASVIHNPDGATTSYYTKRFFARGSQYFFKRPVIEARWDDTTKDQRGDFYYSSSLAAGAGNLNTIYLYNYIRGKLTNIPGIGTDSIFVSLYSGSADDSMPSGTVLTLCNSNTVVTGGHVSRGIYSCSVCVPSSSAETLYDVWHSGTVQFSTGSIMPNLQGGFQAVSKPTYYLNITNLRSKYRSNETARFNLYARDRNWKPTIYTVASSTPQNTTIVSASYRIFRLIDAYDAVPYGTGSDLHTILSYDVSGNYFDFDMSLLEPGYGYAFKFAFYDDEISSWLEQPYMFKFRVEEYEY